MARTKMTFKNKVLKNGNHYMTLDYGHTYTGSLKTASDGDFHWGIDLVSDPNNAKSDYVVAFADGVVTSCANNVSGTNNSTGTIGMGNYVILKHDNGFETKYLHMMKGSVKVVVGQKVKKGDVIGYMGNTGRSTGRHLHFSIDNVSKMPNSYAHGKVYYLDPKPYLNGTASFAKSKAIKRTVTISGGRSLNVRKGPGTNYAYVRSLKQGDTVNEYERSNNWIRIGDNEWISANFVK